MKTIVSIAVCVVLMAAVNAPAAQGASCSNSFYRSIIRDADRLNGPLTRCEKFLNRKSNNMDKMCRVCGPPIADVLRFERKVRANRSCFDGDAKMRRALAQFATARSALQFVRRGCGY